MPNIENYVEFSAWQYDLIRHLFTLTVAVFAAGFVYFILSARNIAPRYRAASFLSAVVMVSAAYEIFSLWLALQDSFTYTGSNWVPAGDDVFSNGYRYANWSIDVPMLLTQLLIALGIAGKAFWSNWAKFTIAGLLMIWTGYIGQYFEPQAAGIEEASGLPFWIWGAVSTVFFVFIVYQVMMLTHKTQGDMPSRARKEFGYIGILLLVSWTLYPFAYGLAAWWPTGEGVVLRQGLYTVADIVSKLVYGVWLTRLAFMRSAYDGFEPAIAAGGQAGLTREEIAREEIARHAPYRRQPATTISGTQATASATAADPAVPPK